MSTNMFFGAIVHEVLTKDNYANWSACVKNYLLSQDLWDIVGTESKQEYEAQPQTWQKKNATALHAIQISCGPDILSQIREFSSAKAAWDFLSKMNEPQSQGEVNEREKPQSLAEISPGDPSLSQGEVNEPKPQSQGQVSEPEKPQSHGESSIGPENGDYVQYLPLIKAVDSGNWEAAKGFLEGNPGAVTARLSTKGQTALHDAAIAGHEKIVKELVNLMSAQDLEIQTWHGDTALSIGVFSCGITHIFQCMVEKNQKLVSIANNGGQIPVVKAAIGGNEDVMRYLYSVTPPEFLTPEKGDNGATLLVHCICGKIFDVALDLLQRCPRLAFSPTCDGLLPVRELANTPSAFRSRSRLVFWQRWIYSC